MNVRRTILFALALGSCFSLNRVRAEEKPLAERIRSIEPYVLAPAGKAGEKRREQFRRMLSTALREERRERNLRDLEAWRNVKSVADWEKLRNPRIAALRKSLGVFPPNKWPLSIRETGTIRGAGFRIRNIAFQSRPGLWVTANLYSPLKPAKSLPGIVICTSHHNPKTQGELQDMGMTWARQGCYVLVMDQLGHGERRQHPFRTSKDYAKPFRVGRQDYYFRYNVGIHLHLIGESLIGWMAWDLMRGIDVLMTQPGIDANRIILLGSVAGGGDPAAVTAALDPRIDAVVPFNFGGPQPENIFPLPKDAEKSFNYIGGGSWESTRNLRLSARDGFLPWVIVGSVAPRKLIYAHEFSWDRERDPVWKRFQRIYEMYQASENLASTNGYGRVTLPSSKASHCNNIGAYHRKKIHAAFAKWFQIPVPNPEYRNRVDSSRLLCIEGVKSASDITLKPVHRLADRRARDQIRSVSLRLQNRTIRERRIFLQKAWSSVLGDVTPQMVDSMKPNVKEENGVLVRRFTISMQRNIRVPVMLLSPKTAPEKPLPVVVCVAQAGKAGFLKNRAGEIARLLKAGVAVCLPDLRGTGETSVGSYRGRRSNATGLSSLRLMLGGTYVGSCLKDLRTVIAALRSLPDIDSKKIALWGDSFANVNSANRNIAVPLRIDDEPDVCEPLGHILALLGSLFENEIVATVSARGGLMSYRSILKSPFVYIPHDVVVPGAIRMGDLPLLVAGLAPKPVWLAGMVNGVNRRVTDTQAKFCYRIGRDFYSFAKADKNFVLDQQEKRANEKVDWLIGILNR